MAQEWRQRSPVGKRAARPAFTLTDLVASLVILAFAAALLLPAVHRASGGSSHVRCASNLRQIAMAAIMYANAEVRSGAFPRVYFDPATVNAPTAYTGAMGAASFAPGGPPPGGPAANDVSAGLYLTLKTQEITSDVFVCPGGAAERWDFGGPGTLATARSNFPSRQYLSYGYNNPYPAASALANGWKFNNSLGPDHPLAADMGPGPGVTTVVPTSGRDAMRAANSPNHNYAGQNVAYCDAHVEFSQTPFCGSPRVTDGFRDHVYTYGGSAAAPAGLGVTGPPQDAADAVLLPAWTDGFQPAGLPIPVAPPSPRWLIPATAILLLAFVVGGAVFLVRRRRARAANA